MRRPERSRFHPGLAPPHLVLAHRLAETLEVSLASGGEGEKTSPLVAKPGDRFQTNALVAANLCLPAGRDSNPPRRAGSPTQGL